MRRLKDRDFLRSLEGFLFCVIGYSHPRDRAISYLKYIPSNEGKWGIGNKRYTRTMPNYTIPSLLNNIKMLERHYPKYVFKSRIFNIQMSAVPYNCIAERYFPEIKLQKLFKSNELDPLEEAAVELVSFISCETKVSKNDFGITGSILTDMHNPHFSDIDLTVYGRVNAWRVKEMLEAPENISLRERFKQHQNKILERWVRDYPITISEAKIISKRRWNYGRFNNRSFSIHAIRKDREIVERYGDKRFFPQGIIEGRAEITKNNESLFLPCTYEVEGLEIKIRDVVEEVNEIVSYDGFYAGLFDCGEYVSIRGKLEMVVDKEGHRHLRVLIGSPEAKGRDYIKPL